MIIIMWQEIIASKIVVAKYNLLTLTSCHSVVNNKKKSWVKCEIRN